MLGNSRLTIRSPWYRTWWAWSLFIAGGGGLLWLATALAVRTRLRYQERLRERAEQQRDRAEAELARQLQHALLLEQASRELGQNRDAASLFGNALRVVAEQFGARQCSIIACSEKSASRIPVLSPCVTRTNCSLGRRVRRVRPR